MIHSKPNTHQLQWFSTVWKVSVFGVILVRISRVQSECGKMWTRITPNTNIFLRRPCCLKWILQVFEILERVHWFSNLVFDPIIFLRNFFVQFFRNFIDCNVRNSHDWVFQNVVTYTVKKMKFSIKDFSSKYDGNCIFVQLPEVYMNLAKHQWWSFFAKIVPNYFLFLNFCNNFGQKSFTFNSLRDTSLVIAGWNMLKNKQKY